MIGAQRLSCWSMIAALLLVAGAAPAQTALPSDGTTQVTAPTQSLAMAPPATSPYNWYFGVDTSFMPLRRAIIFATPSFTLGGQTIPGSVSTITHRTTGVAPMLEARYELPWWMANAPEDFAFGGRFGGYVTGGEREEAFSTRLSTSGSYILN